MKKTLTIILTAVTLGLGLNNVGMAGSAYKLEKGTKITLNQNLTIPAHRASIYIQGGRVLPFSQVDQYYPYCKIEVNKLLDKSQRISADTFTVRKAWTMESSIQQPTQVAGLGIRGGAGHTLTYSTYYRLHSGDQPHVRMLTCEIWGDATSTEHVNVKQMRKALGKIFTIN